METKTLSSPAQQPFQSQKKERLCEASFRFSTRMLRLALASGLVAVVRGHGALVTPRSRNAVDYNEVGCDGGTDTCKPEAKGTGCVNTTHPGEPCHNGQASFWYSQGCFIGCPEWCATATPCRPCQTMPCTVGERFDLLLWLPRAATTFPAAARPTCAASARKQRCRSTPARSTARRPASPNTTSTSACCLSSTASLFSPEMRLLFFFRRHPRNPRSSCPARSGLLTLRRRGLRRHNPWSAPGSAPVADACGLAGGSPWDWNKAEAGNYVNTTNSRHGMKGTSLAEAPTGTEWKIGGEAEVSWQVRNNHGGGYSYRLCPASMPLTEECFQAHHLEFAPEKAGLLFADGSTEMIQPVHVSEGTTPPNSTWAMIPVAPTKLGPMCIAGPHDDPKAPNSCDPKNNPTTPCGCTPCPQTPGSDCSRCDNCYEEPAYPPHVHDGKAVSGVGPVVGIMDVVKVPANLPAGKYVLGWRYDCEATAQVRVASDCCCCCCCRCCCCCCCCRRRRCCRHCCWRCRCRCCRCCCCRRCRCCSFARRRWR
jgi:hypothetical protein